MTTLFNWDFKNGQGPWKTRRIRDAFSSDNCVKYDGDSATLRIRKRDDGKLTTGHIFVPPETFQFTHGYAEARLRFLHPAGAHSSFWLQTTEDYIPGQSEIDVVENYGAKNGKLHHAVHWREPGQKAGEFTDWHEPSDAINGSVGWHDYGVEWTSTGYVFCIDGKDVAECNVGLSDRPKMLVLSILSDEWERSRFGFHEPVWQYRFKCLRVTVRDKR